MIEHYVHMIQYITQCICVVTEEIFCECYAVLLGDHLRYARHGYYNHFLPDPSSLTSSTISFNIPFSDNALIVL